VEGVVVARVVEANVTALDFRFEQLAHDGFRLVSYGLAAPRICYVMTPSDSAPAHGIVYVDHKYWHSSPAALMVLLNSSTA